VINNQYWGLYFNMGSTGPASLKDVKVRQAIAMAVNQDTIISALDGYAAVAHGPIPEISFAYSNQVKYTFNITQAIAALNAEGYVPGSDGIRAKGNDRLSFTLTLVNDVDRITVANVIKDDLKQVGIDVSISPTDSQSILNNNILTHNFDLMLYGVQTLIDPDRYELFDSNEIAPPGLNFESYTSTEQRSTVVNGALTKVPAVDADLEEARRIIDETARTKKYEDFQRIIAAEVPLVFLFHPQDFYLVSKRVQGIDLDSITSIEQRFDSISSWTIDATKIPTNDTTTTN
jgi:peptide/nickel transport system substrate-binding protein